MGVFYQAGDGIEQDASKGVAWYKRSALLGNRNAQYDGSLCVGI